MVRTGSGGSQMDDVLVLWDIDGTLLNAGGVGRDLYGTVFVQLFGRSLSAYAPMAGRTDRAIILETLTLAGVDEPRRHVDPFIAGLCSQAIAMRTAVAAQGQALPGAAEALAALSSAWSLHPLGFLDPARAAADGGHAGLGGEFGPGDAGVPAIPGPGRFRFRGFRVGRRRARRAADPGHGGGDRRHHDRQGDARRQRCRRTCLTGCRPPGRHGGCTSPCSPATSASWRR